jgi:hypothetical protein
MPLNIQCFSYSKFIYIYIYIYIDKKISNEKICLNTILINQFQTYLSFFAMLKFFKFYMQLTINSI